MNRSTPRWRLVALALVGVKLGYWVVVLSFVWWGEGFDAEGAERIRQDWFPAETPPPEHGRWARHVATWDAEHYLYLSCHGYGPGVRSVAFYPLWPLLVRALAPLAGGDHLLAGLVLANLLSLAGWVLFHRLCARRFGERTADLALTLLVAFPGALFFQFLYTEALFFLLLMGLWWGAGTAASNPGWSGGVAAAADAGGGGVRGAADRVGTGEGERVEGLGLASGIWGRAEVSSQK
ncbi:MAG: mannosyltransferase family protein [Verrucomicrobia bacterium]|nr:mannosyltransferase family protein [Verrucomicrobiota bacterium]